MKQLSCLLTGSLFVGTGLLVLLGPVHADLLSSPMGYAVTIPHGWQTTRETRPHSTGASTDMMYAHPPDSFPLFRVEVDPQGRATMADAPAMQSLFVQSKMPGYRVLKQRRRSVAGSPASETAVNGYYLGQPVILDMIFTIHNGRSYTLTLMTTPQTARPDLHLLTELLNTFRWTPVRTMRVAKHK